MSEDRIDAAVIRVTRALAEDDKLLMGESAQVLVYILAAIIERPGVDREKTIDRVCAMLREMVDSETGKPETVQ